MTVRIVVAIGVAALVAGLAATLAQSAPREAGSNNAMTGAQAVGLTPHKSYCQDGETIPKDAGRLQVIVGTFGRPVPALHVSVHGPDGRLVTAGRLPAGSREGPVAIPVRLVETTTPGARVCFEADGTRTVLYGDVGRARLDWFRAGDESWFALTPVVAHRFALGKASLFGPGWLLVVALVMAAAAVLAVRVVLREVSERP
jgi:hypothetical protein